MLQHISASAALSSVLMAPRISSVVAQSPIFATVSYLSASHVISHFSTKYHTPAYAESTVTLTPQCSTTRDWQSARRLLSPSPPPPNLVVLCFQAIFSKATYEIGLVGVREKTHNAETQTMHGEKIKTHCALGIT